MKSLLDGVFSHQMRIRLRRCALRPRRRCSMPQSPAPATAPQFENGLAQPVFAGQPIDPAQRVGRGSESRHRSRRRERSHPRPDLAGRTPPIVARSCRSSWSPVRTRAARVPYPQHDINVPLFVPGGTPAARSRRSRRRPSAGQAVPRQRAADPRPRAERLPDVLPAARIHLRGRQLARHRPFHRLPDDRRRRREPGDEGRHRLVQRQGPAFDVDGAPVDGLLDDWRHRR